MPVLSESLLPGGACSHTILYFGLGAVVLICCGVALRRTSRSQPTSLPQHQDEKSQYNPNSNSWQEKRSLQISPLLTQPPPYASQSTAPLSALPMQGSSFSYYTSPVEVDMNPQSYFDEPFITEEPSSYNSSSSSTSLSEPATMFSSNTYPPYSSYNSPSYPAHLQNQQPLSNKSWFESNPASFSSSPAPPMFFESPNSSYSSTGSVPRRRSYTKTTSSGGSVSGEIVMGDMWRRHTRVFGGGVCKACEESEERMKMVKLKGVGLVAPAEAGETDENMNASEVSSS